MRDARPGADPKAIAVLRRAPRRGVSVTAPASRRADSGETAQAHGAPHTDDTDNLRPVASPKDVVRIGFLGAGLRSRTPRPWPGAKRCRDSHRGRRQVFSRSTPPPDIPPKTNSRTTISLLVWMALLDARNVTAAQIARSIAAHAELYGEARAESASGTGRVVGLSAAFW